MMMQQLSGNLSLLVEPSEKKFRLVITDGSNELACRKETRGNLKRFLTSAQPSLFKGRLQLHKNNEAITVIFKGEAVGTIGVKELKKACG